MLNLSDNPLLILEVLEQTGTPNPGESVSIEVRNESTGEKATVTVTNKGESIDISAS